MAAAGFARRRPARTACAFSRSLSAPKLRLPIGTWTMPAFSTRNSTLPAFTSRTALADVERDRADLRVRHEAARTEDLTEAADLPHHVGRRDRACRSRASCSSWIFFTMSSRTDEVGAGFLRFLRLLALREHEDAHGLARCRAAARPCRARSDRPGADRRRGAPRARRSRRTWPHRRVRSGRRSPLPSDSASRGRSSPPRPEIVLPFGHDVPLDHVDAELRAVPSTVRIAASRLAAVRSGIFMRAISSTCFLVTWPTFFLFGSPDPFSIPAAFLSSTDAGGVFSTNVNDRSAYTVMMTGMMSPGLRLRLRVERLAELHDVHAALTERRAPPAGSDWPRRPGSAASLPLRFSSP